MVYTFSCTCNKENTILRVKLEVRRAENTDFKIPDVDIVYPYIMFQWRIQNVATEADTSPVKRECNSELGE